MKAKVIRSDFEVGPSAYRLFGEDWVLANSVPHPSGQVTFGRKRRIFKPGTVLSFDKAFRLVQNGVCVPVDQECRQRAGLTEEQMRDRQARYERMQESGSLMEELEARENAIPITDDEDDE